MSDIFTINDYTFSWEIPYGGKKHECCALQYEVRHAMDAANISFANASFKDAYKIAENFLSSFPPREEVCIEFTKFNADPRNKNDCSLARSIWKEIMSEYLKDALTNGYHVSFDDSLGASDNYILRTFIHNGQSGENLRQISIVNDTYFQYNTEFGMRGHNRYHLTDPFERNGSLTLTRDFPMSSKGLLKFLQELMPYPGSANQKYDAERDLATSQKREQKQKPIIRELAVRARAQDLTRRERRAKRGKNVTSEFIKRMIF